MRRFTQLFTELDRTTRSSEKLAALERYFREAPPADAAWALSILSGRRLMRALSRPLLRTWVARVADLPDWLVEECYDAVGDWSETLSLLLPGGDGPGTDRPLHELIEARLLTLPELDAADQEARLRDTWAELNRAQRFLLHKLISGNFRVGSAATSVAAALANVAGVSKAVMIHRLMGHWAPTPADYQRLLTGTGDGGGDPAQPYPFFLATPVPQRMEELGDPREWLAEYKWDGIRAQLIARSGAVLGWSRGEEVLNDAFPELVQFARTLPPGTVLDGELLAWEEERPLPFARLQTRLNRKAAAPSFWPDTPVVFMAFDVLESEGHDRRGMPQHWRRMLLERLLAGAGADGGPGPGPAAGIGRVSPLLAFRNWDELAAVQRAAPQRGAEGLMLKRRDATYQVGRPRGDWWKWKVDPHTIDAVLMYAQRGSGRRASLFSDYTFGVWRDGELVPVARAYSGLTDAEMNEVDRFIRDNTLEQRGGFRAVRAELVFELAFEAVQRSTRHKSGVALRFPRMARWRRDKRPADADRLETLLALAGER